jgi:predicted CXXCH cytochrome family protein
LLKPPDWPEKIEPKKAKNKIKDFLFYYWGIWILLAALIMFFAIKIIGNTSHSGEEGEVAEAAATQRYGEPEYLGSERCKDCHWREYDTWKDTLHSKFIQYPARRTVIGDFTGSKELAVKVTDRSTMRQGEEILTTMFKRDGKFFVNTIGPDWEADDYEVIYVLGINRKQNYITKFPNGEMHVLPVEWNAKMEDWTDLNGLKESYPGDGDYWSDPGRSWQIKCGGCHVTGLNVNYDRERNSFDSDWTDLGIGCEACHGPGSNHVKAASVYFENEKETIINPAKLPWRLRAMVCGQCHNWGVSKADVSPSREGAHEKYGYAAGFRPGEPLSRYLDKAPEGEETHHQQYNEWSESEHANAGIMCTNCHNVHQKQISKFAMTKLNPDSLCMNCHITIKRRAAHRIHTFGSCVACHMPVTKGHEHSHTFRFISPALSIKAGGVDKQPNSCSNCHQHKDTSLVKLVEFLDSAKRADMPKPASAHRR